MVCTSLTISLLLFCATQFVTAQTIYENNTIFYVENELGVKFNASLRNETDLLENCPVDGSFTILIHGWQEHYRTFWVRSMIESMLKFRGGCVIFMDYGFYSKLDYGLLMTHFNGLQALVTSFLVMLENVGFNPDNGWLFGFSYGAHLAFEGAYQFGPQRLNRVDTCDPAGPGFPY